MKFSTLPAMLHQRAASEPNATAYVFLSQQLQTMATWTYDSLELRARTIAQQLRSSCHPGDRVLLCFPHGPEFSASFFGCLYAGMIGVPLPLLRGERDVSNFRALAGDATPTCGLTTTTLQAKLASAEVPADAGLLQWLAVDTFDSGAGPGPEEPVVASPPGLAYLQYTSGSTSQPRGVQISHGNVISNLEAIDSDFCHTRESVGVTWLPHYHDMGLVYGLLQPLYNGYPCYVLAPASFAQNPICWLEALTRFKGTHSGGPNFAYGMCAQRVTPAHKEALDLSAWRVAFNGAETVRRQTMDRFTHEFKQCGFRASSFYPTYGLAEATLKVSGTFLKDRRPHQEGAAGSSGGQAVSCGSPAPGTEVCIVDPDNRTRLAEGTAGEIWVRGPGVAGGYWRRRQESQATFEATPETSPEMQASAATYLRTGDIGYIDEVGLTILGRLKDLIIIRGQCHHPEDIEWTVSRAAPGSRSEYCAAFSVDLESEERLVVLKEVGYRLPEDSDECAQAIRQAIAIEHSLQAYAVGFVVHLPKTSSGKVKRSAARKLFLESNKTVLQVNTLKSAVDSGGDRGPTSPVTPQSHAHTPFEIEEFIREQLEHALRAKAPSQVTDVPLARLGLDSLGVLQVVYAIQKRYGVEVSLALALEATVGAIATYVLKSLPSAREAAGKRIVANRDNKGLPVSPEQERLWLMQTVVPHSAAYNLAAGVRIHGNIEPGSLRAALLKIAERHKYLQAVFRQEAGILVAEETSSARPACNVIDLRDGGERAEADARRYIQAEADQPFDLARGPLTRTLLLRLGEQESVFVIVLHHIVADMWSLRILLHELFTEYRRPTNGESSPELAGQRLDYEDFAADTAAAMHGTKMEEHLDYWERTLAGAPPVLPLRLDRPRPSARSHQAGRVSATLPAALYQQIRALAESEGTTPFIVLLAAFALLLQQYSSSDDIVLATSFLNRDRREFCDLIGLFAHPLPLRVDVAGRPAFREVVRRAKAAALQAIDHHTAPFASIVKRLKPERRPGHLPVAQVFFGFNPEVLANNQYGDLLLEPYSVESSATDFDWQMGVTEESGELVIKLRYALDIFNPATASAMLQTYQNTVTHCLASTGASLRELPPAGSDNAQPVPERAVSISIASTFTAEPLQEFLSFWTREFKVLMQTEFVAPGQVFQPLLSPAGHFDYSITLLRVEDWANGTAALEETAREFVTAVTAAAQRTSGLHLVCICPPRSRHEQDSALAGQIARSEQIVMDGLTPVPQIHLLRGWDVAALYDVEQIHDEVSDQVGGIPYTPQFYAAMATALFRCIAARYHAPFKAIASDCDHTLWTGVVGEDGIEGVRISRTNLKLQKVLAAQKNQGKLLCICSKNEQEDVKRIFDSHPDLPLSWKDFAGTRINWAPKSINLRSLAAELGFDLSSFIFIDDDPIECAEVSAGCPQAVTIALPKQDCEAFLDHCWALDAAGTTEEDSRRTEFYLTQQQREGAGTYKTLREYIEGLQLEYEMLPVTPERLPRVVELMYRTTQFNNNGYKTSSSVLRSMLDSGQIDGFAFQVTDRFGDYGIVGAVLYSEDARDLLVKSMLLSCRALGRGVEYKMTAELGRVALARGLEHVAIPFIASSRNQPALNFLESAFGNKEATSHGVRYRMPAAQAAMIEPSYEAVVAGRETQEKTPASAAAVERPAGVNIGEQFMRIATSLRSAAAIIEAARGAAGKTGETNNGVAPLTADEQTVACIWRDVLGVDVPSVNSDFFDLGGDSLKAVRVISHIQSAFGVMLPLSVFFDQKLTIAALCTALQELSKEPALSAP
jgi:FkbH-like protein